MATSVLNDDLHDNSNCIQNALSVQDTVVKTELCSFVASDNKTVIEIDESSSRNHHNSSCISDACFICAVNALGRIKIGEYEAHESKMINTSNVTSLSKHNHSAFKCWLKENREKVKEKYADLRTPKFLGKMHVLWNELEKTRWTNETDNCPCDKEFTTFESNRKNSADQLASTSCNEICIDSNPCTPCKDKKSTNINDNEGQEILQWYGSGSAFKSIEFIETSDESYQSDEQ